MTTMSISCRNVRKMVGELYSLSGYSLPDSGLPRWCWTLVDKSNGSEALVLLHAASCERAG